ncbi:hypothetical protein CMUS01_03812 [Colletotrichum musicola]|uniref:Uncharacterized protein n=1 Tax=Colletotrichum musicola TaxID=2175873 RepID=A0A8H6U4P2_9PEZI|nr:hypothetical protein CMUS01_03812 [Colletotrichum musicola]
MGLFKSANPPNPNPPSRSMTGQSIRGKISGPIPIPSPADDEFPMRNPGTGIATPVTAGDMREQQMHPPQAEPATASIVSVPRPDVSQAPATDAAAVPPGSGGSASGSSPTSASHGHSPQSQRRTNASNLRYSVVSASSEQTGVSRDRPQRKKSTLRGALGKLFGRKKKSNSQGSYDSQRVSVYNPSNNNQNQNQNQHKSDITTLNRVKESEPKRSASLPITEYDRALRSHSIGPQDITAIESARNSITVDLSQPSHRRAKTTTISQIYSAPFRHRDGELAGLSPRPASTHARGSRLFHSDDEDPEEIGRAITSDVGHKRRSRSLSGINNPEVRTDLRRRSDEIRYWRQSYDPAFIASPASSNPPDHENQFAGVAAMDMPESPVSPIEQGSMPTPPQPFSFGNLTQPHLNAMAGMKITQAASIETRIETLEGRMQRMEDVVTQLCNSVPGFQMHFHHPGRAAPPVPGSHQSQMSNAVNPALQQVSRQDVPTPRYSSSAHSKESHTSFGEIPTYIGSLQLSTPMNRPTSNATIRGVTSLPAISRAETSAATETFTADHYTMLLALLETERASRQALESQVKKLTRRINMISGPNGHGRMSLQMEPPPTAKSFGSVSAFDHDSSDDEDSKNRRYLAEDSGVGTGVGDDDSYSEVFATPREEQQPHSYGAFGEELLEDEEDPQRKKAARTLSLSQMTLGKKSSRTGVRS